MVLTVMKHLRAPPEIGLGRAEAERNVCALRPRQPEPMAVAHLCGNQDAERVIRERAERLLARQEPPPRRLPRVEHLPGVVGTRHVNTLTGEDHTRDVNPFADPPASWSRI